MKHILILLAFTLTALAHPGKTDSKGGHTDSKTGVYHLHKAPEPVKPAPKKPEAKKPATKKPTAKKK